MWIPKQRRCWSRCVEIIETNANMKSGFESELSAADGSILTCFRDERRCLMTALALLGVLLIAGCGSAHDELIIGPYRLVAVDLDEQMSISYDLGGGSAVGRIDQTVFAYGFDERFIVAKQHPNNDRSLTRYFFLEIAKDSKYAEPSDSVTGPLTLEEFEGATERLGLPEFTRTIEALR